MYDFCADWSVTDRVKLVNNGIFNAWSMANAFYGSGGWAAGEWQGVKLNKVKFWMWRVWAGRNWGAVGCADGIK